MNEFIGLHLAQHGIPSDVEWDVAGDYEFDPWRPEPGCEVIHITIPADKADALSRLLQPTQTIGPRCNCGAVILVVPDERGILRDVDHLNWCNVAEGSQ